MMAAAIVANVIVDSIGGGQNGVIGLFSRIRRQ
jgi:hypothetical protein